MGAVTVITSGKGGVGKSTIAVGISRAYASVGRRVILIDLDAGLRSLDRLTGVDKDLVYDISDVVFGRCAPIEAIYPCEGYNDLFLMPAPLNGDDVLNLVNLKRLVKILKNHYDHIVLDCPAGVGRGFKSAIAVAEKAVVVCNPDPVCLRSTAKVHSLLVDAGIIDQKLVINRFNADTFNNIHGFKDLDSVIDEAQIQLIGIVPEDNKMISAFLNLKTDESSKGILACARIANRLEGKSIPLKF